MYSRASRWMSQSNPMRMSHLINRRLLLRRWQQSDRLEAVWHFPVDTPKSARRKKRGGAQSNYGDQASHREKSIAARPVTTLAGRRGADRYGGA
jgi:hypothetical protein